MRSLWFVAGAGAGVYVVLRARRAAEALTPEGWHDRAAGLRVGWQLFGDEVRAGMAEKETELRERLLVPLPEDKPLLTSSAIEHDGEGSGPDGLTRDPTTVQ